MEFFLKKLISIQITLAQGDTGITPPGAGDTGVRPRGIFDLPNPLGTETKSIPTLLDRIWEYLYKISIPLVAIMVLIGAFQLMFAGGNEEKVKTGKKTILYAVVGFAIVLLADGITAVMKEILGFK